MRVTAVVKNSLKLFAIFFSSLQRSPLISIVLEKVDFFSLGGGGGGIVFIVVQKAVVILN